MTENNTNGIPSADKEVNVSWQQRFKLLERVGADQLSIYSAMSSEEYKALGFWEKRKISFNTLAFLFGPIYYFFKGLWYKGAAIIAIYWLATVPFTLLEIIFDFRFPAVVWGAPIAVVSAQLATYDYFRLIKHNEKMWRVMPNFLATPAGAIGTPIATFVLLLVITMLSV